MKRRLSRVVAWVVLAAGLVTLFCALWLSSELRRPFAGWPAEYVDVQIPQGLAAGQTIQRLHEAGVIRDPRVLRLWLAWDGGSESLQAGEYRFSEPASPLQVLARLQAGEILLHRVTLPEGLRIDETARRIADAGFSDYESLLAAFGDPAPIRDLDPDAADLEGYLFPETYFFPRDSDAIRIARVMVERFVEVVGPDYGRRAEEAGLGFRRAVTLASLIEKETSLAPERGRVSRVFHNRLSRRMKLQCDPTVIYALHRAGLPNERLTRADLALPSPWNTYHVFGLPPGPIASPGQASLDAAVAPGEGKELYFVASPDGGHRFSEDLASHNQAVAAWRRYLRSSR